MQTTATPKVYAIACDFDGTSLYRTPRDTWIFSLAATFDPERVRTFQDRKEAERHANSASLRSARHCYVVRWH